MDESAWPLLACSSICLALTLLVLSRNRRNPTTTSGRLPPGPPGWPVFGNMFDLGSMPHRSLAAFKSKYGPLIWLRLGAINTLVVSSPAAAMELFKNHDLSFCDRAVNDSLTARDFYKSSFSFGQYGPYWRMLKRLCSSELFANKSINDTTSLRRRCVDDMIGSILEEVQETGRIEVARSVFRMNLSMIGNLVLSADLKDPKLVHGEELFQLTIKLVELSAKPNVADFFPLLRWLDPQGIRRKMERLLGRALEIAAGFVKDRVQEQSLEHEKHDKKKDFLDVLMEFQGNREDEPNKISSKNIEVFILELFIAATETTNSTTEWAMTELLRNPESMNRAKAELDRVVGCERKVEENDIGQLQYLQAVVKETLRLHPPIPLLVPRRAVEDTELMGYWIPKGTQVFVNVWGLGRDPEAWDDPTMFKPERFLGSSSIDYWGQHFQFIPFGAGRRMCPGLPLANKVLHLLLATLLQSFNWALEEGVTPETLDMSEKFGTTLRKAVPLKAKATPRPQVV